MMTGIILAAGEARRMGRVKQLLDWHGEPLIRHVVRKVRASRFDRVRVILGAGYEQILPVISDLDVEVIYNPDYRRGQSTSVGKGLEGLAGGVKGAAFLLADQPLTRIETYDRLIRAFACGAGGILIPTWQGQRGNPVFFDQQFFPLLREAEGDRGGRDVIRQNPDRVRLIEVDDPGVVTDIDVEEDYLRLLNEARFFT